MHMPSMTSTAVSKPSLIENIIQPTNLLALLNAHSQVLIYSRYRYLSGQILSLGSNVHHLEQHTTANVKV